MLLSTLASNLYKKVTGLGRSKFWLLILGMILVIVIMLNGIGHTGGEYYQSYAENPLITRTDIASKNYFQQTVLLPVVAFFLRLTSPAAYYAFCFAIIVGAYFLFAVLTARRWEPSAGLIFSTLLITSPISTILFSWLGMPDGLSVALVIPLLFTNSVFLIFLLAALGSMNHIAFLFAAAEVVVLRWISRDGVKLHHALAMAAGGITGTLMVKAFFAFRQIEAASRSEFIFSKSIWDWAKLNAAHLPLSLFSLFNIQWLALLVCFLMFYKWDKRFYLSLLAFLVFNYIITFVSLDTTRIFSLLSFGIFMLCIFHSYDLAQNHPEASPEHQKQFLQALILIGIISIFSPRYFAWAGEIHATPFYEFLKQLIH